MPKSMLAHRFWGGLAIRAYASAFRQETKNLDTAPNRHVKWEAIERVIPILDRLHIPHPGPRVEPHIWRAFLAHMVVSADTGDIFRARAVMLSEEWSSAILPTNFGAPSPAPSSPPQGPPGQDEQQNRLAYIPDLQRCLDELIKYSGYEFPAKVKTQEVARSNALSMLLERACDILDEQGIDHPKIEKNLVVINYTEWIEFLSTFLASDLAAPSPPPSSSRPQKGAPDNPAANPIDPEDYQGIKVFMLGEAACLWAGVAPHEPITNPKARALFTKLASAMVIRQLECENPLLNTLSRITDDGRWWPTYSERITAIALRKYADRITDVPAFLQWVKVTVEQEQTREVAPE